MAFVDRGLELADNLAVTTTGTITNVVDLGVNPTTRSLSLQNAYLVIDCTADVDDAGAGAATVTIKLVSDSAAALTTSPTTHWSSAALAVTLAGTPSPEMFAGQTVTVLPLPVKANYERYLGVSFTITDGPLSTGAFNVYITHDPSIRTLYPDAI